MTENEPLGPPWTILKILRWTTDFLGKNQSSSPRLDAELLLSQVLDLERIHLYTSFDRPMAPNELDAYRALVKRRASGEPCAYILGHREFWTLDLKVDPRVLIPRPDTETLVRSALDRIDQDSTARLVDIGTGSGAVALSIASERPALQIAATDIDDDALALAAENAEIHGLSERVSFHPGDLLEALNQDWTPLEFIVSNPPYIGESERANLSSQVREFEPTKALFAGEDGLDTIRRLIAQSFDSLGSGGHLLFEIGYKQGPAVRKLLQEAGFESIEIIQDYGDRDRVAAAQKP